MKISKKIIGMLLCGFIAIGGSQLSLVKANAASTNETDKPVVDVWEECIRLKLRAKHNSLYKSWWKIFLVCDSKGHLRLKGSTAIPNNLTFDDNIIMGPTDLTGYYRPRHSLCFEVGPSWGSASADLQDAMRMFNEYDVHVGQLLYAHGRNWDGTLRFDDENNLIDEISNNDFSKGYRTVDKWNTEFIIQMDGLDECSWNHFEVQGYPFM